MDAFSPRQFGWQWQSRHLQPPITTFGPNPNVDNTIVEHNSSAATIKDPTPVVNAFKVIAILNVPAVLAFTRLSLCCGARTQREFAQWKINDPLGRLSARYLASKIEFDWIRRISQKRFEGVANAWLEYIAFKPSSPFTRPWTLLTHSFVHPSPQHFLANMFALWQVMPVCAQIFSLSIPHICGVVLGSSVCGCIGNWIDDYIIRTSMSHATVLELPQYAAGASAVISAFTAMATAARPTAWAGINLYISDIRYRMWFSALLAFGNDAFQILRQSLPGLKRLLPPAIDHKRRVGHCAHLMGGLFGLLYYLLLLRSGDSPGIVLSEDQSSQKRFAEKRCLEVVNSDTVTDLGEQTAQSTTLEETSRVRSTSAKSSAFWKYLNLNSPSDMAFAGFLIGSIFGPTLKLMEQSAWNRMRKLFGA